MTRQRGHFSTKHDVYTNAYTFQERRQVARDPFRLGITPVHVHVRSQSWEHGGPLPELHEVAGGAVAVVEQRGRRRGRRLCVVQECEPCVR